MVSEETLDDEPNSTSLTRGVIGLVGVGVGVTWAVYLGSKGVHAGLLFELLPPLALIYIGTVFAYRHLP